MFGYFRRFHVDTKNTLCKTSIFKCMSAVSCKELYLDNIISISVFRSSAVVYDKPPMIFAGVVTVGAMPAPMFVAALTEGDGALLMSGVPTLKITNSRSAVGNVFTHELTIPVFSDREQMETVVNQLQGVDFDVIYTRADGSRAMSRALPHVPTCDLEEQFATSNTLSLKLKMQSMSAMVEVKA